MHHRIPKRDLQEAWHHQDQMRCVTQGNCHTPIILCCRKWSKGNAEKNQTFMSRWLKPESQWLGLTDDTLANFVFEKANHTWATRLLWEKLHWNTRCQHFKKRRCKHWNKAITVQQIPQNPPHLTLTLNAERSWVAKFLFNTICFLEAKAQNWLTQSGTNTSLSCF